ncbi:Uncharacterized protein HZ326_12705 [Fusarium oxysporum f. sp. albedinis]|nr:Uncharacterized protein HZ326_12705 [Fusarium oxysporum f. sp. albedinis]
MVNSGRISRRDSQRPTTIGLRQLKCFSFISNIIHAITNLGALLVWFGLTRPKKFVLKYTNNFSYSGHHHVFFQDFGTWIETFAPDKPKQWLATLYTNIQIYAEAREHDSLLRSFLSCIGSTNANLLSHLSISFPVAQGQPKEVNIRQDSLKNLALLSGKRNNLKTLEIQVSGESSMLLTEADPQFAQEALQCIDAELRTVSSVDKIIVRVHTKNLPSSVVDLLQGFGWVVLNR